MTETTTQSSTDSAPRSRQAKRTMADKVAALPARTFTATILPWGERPSDRENTDPENVPDRSTVRMTVDKLPAQVRTNRWASNGNTKDAPLFTPGGNLYPTIAGLMAMGITEEPSKEFQIEVTVKVTHL